MSYPTNSTEFILLIVMTVLSAISFVIVSSLACFTVSKIRKAQIGRKIKQNDKFMVSVIVFIALVFLSVLASLLMMIKMIMI